MYVEGYGLTVAVGAEYDVRFTSAQPNEAAWFVTLGLTRERRLISRFDAEDTPRFFHAE